MSLRITPNSITGASFVDGGQFARPRLIDQFPALAFGKKGHFLARKRDPLPEGQKLTTVADEQFPVATAVGLSVELDHFFDRLLLSCHSCNLSMNNCAAG